MHERQHLAARVEREDIGLVAGVEPQRLGHAAIAVAEGIATQVKNRFTQARWAQEGPSQPHPQAVEFLLRQIRENPGELTLVATAKVTGKVLDDADHRRLIEDAIKDLDFSALEESGAAR